MNTYRNDLEAALQRMVALETELSQAKREQERLELERDGLHIEVRRLRAEVDRLRYRWSEPDGSTLRSPR